MKVKVWGARGSVPTLGPSTNRYGGNTSSLQVTLADGTLLVLDAGSGIRALGLRLAGATAPRIDILLTHLHLDHIQGLMFFAPLFMPDAEIVLWGPPATETLSKRLARYLSPPLTPLHLHELPCRLSFRACPTGEWEIGPARVQAAPVIHPGPTLGYSINEGDTSLCYIPARSSPSARRSAGANGGRSPASTSQPECRTSSTTASTRTNEYPSHVGWGHSRLSDVLTFAQLTEAQRLLLFHHDPLHDDEQLDRLHTDALERWEATGRSSHEVALAAELQELELATPTPTVQRVGSCAL